MSKPTIAQQRILTLLATSSPNEIAVSYMTRHDALAIGYASTASLNSNSIHLNIIRALAKAGWITATHTEVESWSKGRWSTTYFALTPLGTSLVY